MTAEIEISSLPEQLKSRYQLKQSRFASASASLFEGTDPSTGQAVVVRVMREGAFVSAAERQRARRELQKLATVRHETLASVVDVGEAGDLTWCVRELVEGETVADRIARAGALDAGLAAWVVMKSAAALAELHRHGVQHRDLRPERIVITREGGLKVLDAAVGRVTQLADGRVVPGTPGYVAPEAITGRLVSFRSDLYALGATLYEVLAGRPTFPAADASRRVQLQTETDPAALDASVPEPLARLTFNLLAREQRDRPFSAQQVERQLETLARAPSATEDAIDAPVEGERTVAIDTSAAPPAAPAPLPAPPPATLADDGDDRSDEAPTRLNAHLDLPFTATSTIVGMTAPVVTPATPSAAAAPATSNSRLPKMPTLPPIPSAANRASIPSPAVAAPPPGPARKSTIVGMPMNELAGGAAVAPPSAPPAAPAPTAAPPTPARPVAGRGGLDYDDLGDTTINDESRAFGLPGYTPGGAAAVAPVLPPPTPPVSAVPPPPAYDPMSATMMAAAPAPMPMPMPPPDGVASTVMMQMPAPPGPAVPPPGPPNAGPPMGMQPAPGMQSAPAAPPAYVAPQAAMPAAPAKRPNVLLWIVGILNVTAAASLVGLGVAKARHHEAPPPETVTIVPQLAAAPPTNPDPAAAPTPAPPAVAMVPTPAPDPVAPPPVPAPDPVAPPPAPAPEPVAPPPAVAMQPVAAPPPAPAPVAAPPPAPTPAPVVAHRDPAPRTQPAAHASNTTAPTPRTTPAPTAARTTPTPAPAAARTTPTPAPTPAPAPAAATGNVGANDPRITEALRARNYPQARTLLQSALHSQPNNAALHAQLGNVYERLGNRADALNEYRTATRLDRRNTQYMHRLVDLLVATNDRAGAIATLRQILAISPNDRAAQGRLQALGAQ